MIDFIDWIQTFTLVLQAFVLFMLWYLLLRVKRVRDETERMLADHASKRLLEVRVEALEHEVARLRPRVPEYGSRP